MSASVNPPAEIELSSEVLYNEVKDLSHVAKSVILDKLLNSWSTDGRTVERLCLYVTSKDWQDMVFAEIRSIAAYDRALTADYESYLMLPHLRLTPIRA